MSRATNTLEIIRHVYGGTGPIPLHAPIFDGNESIYVQDAINSTFVSSVGAYVDQFERLLCDITGAAHVVATTNGTTALQMALILAGVSVGDLVITQSLSFVATANAITHANALPAFVDVAEDTLGMSPKALLAFLQDECRQTIASGTVHTTTGRRVAACVPMHSFGLPCEIAEIVAICSDWKIPVVEDAAEALGSRSGDRHCGTFGRLGTLSFNGNKICTTGGGGAIVTNHRKLAERAKHLTTTAKVPHRWRFEHDAVGYNFRLPNLNAALGCAQLEQLDKFIAFKRELARRYRAAFSAVGVPFIGEPAGTYSNYWICAVLMQDQDERDECLKLTNDNGVLTRPAWEPLHTLPMYSAAPHGPLEVTLAMAARLVNIPSGVRRQDAA
jgi:aminotransferase in exopolysaccharide biosynthesis